MSRSAIQCVLRVVLQLLVAATAAAQTNAQSSDDRPARLVVPPAYAGKYSPRIGATIEPQYDRLRLDIGYGSDLLTRQFGRFRAALGAEFFTWTRLRSEPNFKFPVEAVDYWFGTSVTIDGPMVVRLRVAHISAHLVDGSAAFGRDGLRPVVYSREFADVMAGVPLSMGGRTSDPTSPRARPYGGVLWLFHTIPDTLGTLTPYVGFDASWRAPFEYAMNVRAGYELRLNTELTPTSEHLARLGVKFAEANLPGLMLEASYYRGRSPFGQFFSILEEHVSIGFALEF